MLDAAAPMPVAPVLPRRPVAQFLEDCGWGGAAPAPLTADASFRTYYRLRRGARTAVLMDAPPPHEDVRPFVAVAAILRGLGLSAPTVLARDVEAGFLLLEDLGDDTYTRVLARGGDELALYTLAVDALVALQRAVAASRLPDLPPYDEDRLLAEAALLVDWYLPMATGGATEAALREEYLARWRQVLPAATPARPTLVLRDYHVDNLMLLPGRAGVTGCGILDFQDAVIGSPCYDLVSLIEDARRDVSPSVRAAMTARYLAAFPELDGEGFARSAAILAVQRNCKILGIFTRLWRRDGKPQYLPHIARLWRLIEGDLGEPALAPIADWLDRRVPAPLRRLPEPPVRA